MCVNLGRCIQTYWGSSCCWHIEVTGSRARAQVGREASKSQLSTDDDNRNNAQCQHSQSGNGSSEGADRKRESSAHGKVCYL